MGVIVDAITAPLRPLADAASRYGEARERTAQTGHDAWARIQEAAASWRPWLARLLGCSIAVHVAGSALLLAAGVYARISSATWSVVAEWALWMAYGRDLFDLTVTLLGLYIGSRGVEKIAPAIGGTLGKAAASVASLVTGRRAEPIPAPEPLVRREPMARVPSNIVRLDGITVPGRAAHVAPTSDSGFVFGPRSLANRAELDEPMQRVADKGLAYSPYDWVMTDAGRTFAEQRGYVESGASRTMDSRHCEIPAQAFDIMVLDENGNGTWDLDYYRPVADAIKRAAAEEGVGITAGIDWGWDAVHFERSREELPFRRPVQEAA